MTSNHGSKNTTVDVLIIGAGASGAAAAASLSEAGFKVKCLEQGFWQDPSKYASASADYDFEMLTNWSVDPNKRQLDEDYPINIDNSPVTPVMFNGVGGSTILWTAHTPRFHPSDFRVKTLDGVADDWPLTYEDLAGYYDRNDEVMGCSGINGDPANPPRKPRQMPPLPIGSDGMRLINAFEELDWHWWPSDNYINSEPYGEGRDACNFCGHVHMGCFKRAKASTDLTYWPLALNNGAVIETGARVRRVTTNSSGSATGADYVDAKGVERHQPARSVVMAANGIGTARLLLLSKSDSHPDGLANSSGLVGKNLMFHPFAMITGVFPEKMKTWQGPLSNFAMSQEFYETDESRGFVRGYTYQFQRSLGPSWVANGGFTNAIPWGDSHHEELEKRLGSMMAIAVIGDDLPELHNSVDLDPNLTDSDGVPAPRINYTLSENSRDLLDHGIKNATKVFETAGATDIYVDPLMRQSGWHLMGTARMGEDSSNSVVDKWGQAHDVDNLFIIDGSVFVTGAAVNPTPTIQALALRTADYIIANRNDLRG